MPVDVGFDLGVLPRENWCYRVEYRYWGQFYVYVKGTPTTEWKWTNWEPYYKKPCLYARRRDAERRMEKCIADRAQLDAWWPQGRKYEFRVVPHYLGHPLKNLKKMWR